MSKEDYLMDIQMPEDDVDDNLESPSPRPTPESTKEPSHNDIVLKDEPLLPSEPEETLPEPVKREKLLKADIFKKKPAPKVLDISELSGDDDDDDIPGEPSPPPVKKKRKASPAQLAALARGRETKAIQKKINMAKKDEIKSEKLRAKSARLERNVELEIAREEKKAKKIQYQKDNPPQETFTKADMLAATNEALEKFEYNRKAQKAIKRKEQAKAQHDAKVYKSINNALGVRDDDIYANCFSFT